MRTQMPDDYQIPDDPDTGRMDAAYLRTCMGIRTMLDELPPALPDAVRRAHHDMARSLSILGATGPAGMTPTQLATVVALALRDPDMAVPPLEEETPPSFMEEVDAGRVKPGQQLVVHWQRKDQSAHFVQKDGDRLLLLLNGNERRFRPDLVRYPKKGEFAEAAENINEPVGV